MLKFLKLPVDFFFDQFEISIKSTDPNTDELWPAADIELWPGGGDVNYPYPG